MKVTPKSLLETLTIAGNSTGGRCDYFKIKGQKKDYFVVTEFYYLLFLPLFRIRQCIAKKSDDRFFSRTEVSTCQEHQITLTFWIFTFYNCRLWKYFKQESFMFPGAEFPVHPSGSSHDSDKCESNQRFWHGFLRGITMAVYEIFSFFK